MAALGVLIITTIAAGHGLWLRHSCIKEIKEQQRWREEIHDMRNRRRKRR